MSGRKSRRKNKRQGKLQSKSGSSSSLSGTHSSPDVEAGSRHRHAEILEMPVGEVMQGVKSPKIVEQLKLVVEVFENMDLSTANKFE